MSSIIFQKTKNYVIFLVVSAIFIFKYDYFKIKKSNFSYFNIVFKILREKIIILEYDKIALK